MKKRKKLRADKIALTTASRKFLKNSDKPKNKYVLIQEKLHINMKQHLILFNFLNGAPFFVNIINKSNFYLIDKTLTQCFFCIKTKDQFS